MNAETTTTKTGTRAGTKSGASRGMSKRSSRFTARDANDAPKPVTPASSSSSRPPALANDEAPAASGIYYVSRDASGAAEAAGTRETMATVGTVGGGAKRMNAMLEHVTLVVYGWRNVEPGTLSWVFPSVGAAVSAARAMKNAVKWAIVAGRRDARGAEGTDLEDARAHGAVLIEEA